MPNEPLLSNEDIGSNMDVYEASLEKHTSHNVTMRLNMTTAYGAGIRNTRDIYEAALTASREREKKLVEALTYTPNENGLMSNAFIMQQAVAVLRSAGHMTLAKELLAIAQAHAALPS